MEFRSDRRYRFAVAPPTFWTAVSDVPSFPRWWPWLRDFDGRRLAPGEVWTCAVHPPLPYVVRFRLTIVEVDEPRFIRADVEGDITGRATLDVEPAGTGTAVRLRSALAPAHAWLRAVAAVARPAVRHGHDWVLDTGARQFVARATPTRSATPPERPGHRGIVA